MKLLAALAGAAAIASPLADGARFVRAHEDPSGAYAERGAPPGPALTAWAVLGLRAAGTPAAELARSADYLEQAKLETPTEVALAAVALSALGRETGALLARLPPAGPTVNATIWTVLAHRAAGRAAPAGSVRYLLRHQHRAGGWSWAAGGAPDSNDTAAAVQALRSAGVRGRPIARALAYLRTTQNRDGGFGLVRGRASDAQSTAWAVQAYVAAGAKPPPPALRYLARMRRPDGSYRYSARYVTTPVWVTSQVLPALARKPFPFR